MEYLKTTLFLFLSFHAVSSANDYYYTVERLESEGFTNDVQHNMEIALRCPKYTSTKTWKTEEGKRYAEELEYFSDKLTTDQLIKAYPSLEDWVTDQNAMLDIVRLLKHGFVGPTGKDNLRRLEQGKIHKSGSEICGEYEEHITANENTPNKILNIYQWYTARNNFLNLMELFTFYSTKPFFETEELNGQ